LRHLLLSFFSLWLHHSISTVYKQSRRRERRRKGRERERVSEKVWKFTAFAFFKPRERERDGERKREGEMEREGGREKWRERQREKGGTGGEERDRERKRDMVSGRGRKEENTMKGEKNKENKLYLKKKITIFLIYLSLNFFFISDYFLPDIKWDTNGRRQRIPGNMYLR
jgi:hypothetical protein